MRGSVLPEHEVTGDAKLSNLDWTLPHHIRCKSSYKKWAELNYRDHRHEFTYLQDTHSLWCQPMGFLCKRGWYPKPTYPNMSFSFLFDTNEKGTFIAREPKYNQPKDRTGPPDRPKDTNTGAPQHQEPAHWRAKEARAYPNMSSQPIASPEPTALPLQHTSDDCSAMAC
jgi:hypothetical protein